MPRRPDKVPGQRFHYLVTVREPFRENSVRYEFLARRSARLACAPSTAADMLDLDDIFGQGGPLARALPDFKVRARQQPHGRSASPMRSTARESLVVEAGTGTGKTFAYLVPALLSGLRVLISTGTRTLQDQLFAKDLPLVPRPSAARRAWRCSRAAPTICAAIVSSASTATPSSWTWPTWGHRARAPGRRCWRASQRWARTTPRGDLAEVRGLSDTHPLWPQVTSTRENCLGQRCPEFARCHVVLARREALDADIVIVNHHLLLADLALKEDGFGDLLGIGRCRRPR